MKSITLTRSLAYQFLVVGFLVMFFSTCIKSLYQVYFSDLYAHFGRGQAGFAWSGSLFMLVMGLASPLVGRASDRYGPLVTIGYGCGLSGAGLLLAALFHDSLPVFIASYGLLCAFGMAAMTYVPMGVLVDRVFDKQKAGFAYSIVSNGTSISFIIFSPVWLWVAPRVRWERIFLWNGLFFLLPLTILVGYMAMKWAAKEDKQNMAKIAGGGPKIWPVIAKDRGFYVLALSFFGCGASMAFIDVHLVAFWQEGMVKRSLMGSSLSLLGILELLSGLAVSGLALRMSKRKLLGGLYLVRTAAILLLLSAPEELKTLGFAVLFGMTYLGSVVLTSLFCLERYGVAVKGQAFGWLFLSHQLGAFASVQLGAVVHDIYGNYRCVVIGLACLTAFCGLSVLAFLRERLFAFDGEVAIDG